MIRGFKILSNSEYNIIAESKYQIDGMNGALISKEMFSRGLNEKQKYKQVLIFTTKYEGSCWSNLIGRNT